MFRGGKNIYRATDGQNIGEENKMKKNNVVKIAVTSSLNSQNLSAEELAEVMNWKYESKLTSSIRSGGKTAEAGLKRQYVSAEGLAQLAEAGLDIFVAKTGFTGFPHNLVRTAMSGAVGVVGRFGRVLSVKEADQQILSHGRFGGWIRAAATLRGCRKIIEKTQSSRGINSGRTTVDLWTLVQNNPSPGGFEEKVWKVRRRANQVLKPYGISVSWASIGQVLQGGCRNIGKAARRAVEKTVQNYLSYYTYEANYRPYGNMDRCFFLKAGRGLAELKSHPDAVQRWAVGRTIAGEFESIRDALQNANRLTQDNTDGVEMYLDSATREEIHRVEVFKGWMADQSGKFGQQKTQHLFRQVHTDRTYHLELGYMSERDGVKEAIKAWRRQAELERKNKEIFSVLQPKNASVLVWFEDSLDSGNCESGTRAWAEANGFNGDMFVSAEKLLKFSGDPRVFRVLQTAAEKVVELKLVA
jgi:hypothetical protein